eukprot:2921114-Alexandrium_andersonii.AAC.1
MSSSFSTPPSSQTSSSPSASPPKPSSSPSETLAAPRAPRAPSKDAVEVERRRLSQPRGHGNN